MKTKSQRKFVDTRTIKGLQLAEKLKASGWEIVGVGFTTIEFVKKSA